MRKKFMFAPGLIITLNKSDFSVLMPIYDLKMYRYANQTNWIIDLICEINSNLSHLHMTRYTFRDFTVLLRRYSIPKKFLQQQWQA